MQLARARGASDDRGSAAKGAIDTTDDREPGGASRVGRVPDGDPELRKVGVHAPLAGAFSCVAPARWLQSAHVTTPRMLHMLQMKRPHSEHGYPSDARSSLLHARHSIASRSRSSVITFSQAIG